MSTKLTRPFTAATLVVAVVFLVAPASALAQDAHKRKHPPSAVDVYVEQVQTAGGHQAVPTTGGTSNTGGGSGESTSSSVPLPAKVKQQLAKQGGKDTALLSELAGQAGNDRRLAAVGSASQPGTLDAAFDLGAGPTLIFALVLGTGLFVLVGGGLRSYRRRHPRA
jgi:hypothetical protein